MPTLLSKDLTSFCSCLFFFNFLYSFCCLNVFDFDVMFGTFDSTASAVTVRSTIRRLREQTES